MLYFPPSCASDEICQIIANRVHCVLCDCIEQSTPNRNGAADFVKRYVDNAALVNIGGRDPWSPHGFICCLTPLAFCPRPSEYVAPAYSDDYVSRFSVRIDSISAQILCSWAGPMVDDTESYKRFFASCQLPRRALFRLAKALDSMRIATVTIPRI